MTKWHNKKGLSKFLHIWHDKGGHSIWLNDMIKQDILYTVNDMTEEDFPLAKWHNKGGPSIWVTDTTKKETPYGMCKWQDKGGLSIWPTTRQQSIWLKEELLPGWRRVSYLTKDGFSTWLKYSSLANQSKAGFLPDSFWPMPRDKNNYYYKISTSLILENLFRPKTIANK